jgi:hypothetical protein
MHWKLITNCIFVTANTQNDFYYYITWFLTFLPN